MFRNSSSFFNIEAFLSSPQLFFLLLFCTVVVNCSTLNVLKVPWTSFQNPFSGAVVVVSAKCWSSVSYARQCSSTPSSSTCVSPCPRMASHPYRPCLNSHWQSSWRCCPTSKLTSRCRLRFVLFGEFMERGPDVILTPPLPPVHITFTPPTLHHPNPPTSHNNPTQ